MRGVGVSCIVFALCVFMVDSYPLRDVLSSTAPSSSSVRLAGDNGRLEWNSYQRLPSAIGRGPNGEELDENGDEYADEDDEEDADYIDVVRDTSDEDDDSVATLGVKMPHYPEPVPLSEREAREKGCDMNPPFLYINFHTGPNVARYTKDGCYLGKDVLYTEPDGTRSRGVEFRSMVIAPYEEHEQAMYIANAAKRGSQVLVYSPCGVKSELTAAGSQSIKAHQRDLLKVITAKHSPRRKGRESKFRGTFKRNAGANHCFGIAVNAPNVSYVAPAVFGGDGRPSAAGIVPPAGNGEIFASFQHTNVVLWFDYETKQEKNLPISVTQDILRDRKPYYPGTFHQFGFPNGGRMPMGQRSEGVRALEVVTGADGARKLWVANEGISAVSIISIDTGITEALIQVECPIAMFHFKRSLAGGDDRVYIGSSTTHSSMHPRPPGKVYAVNPRTHQVEDEYSMPQWVHPVGMFAAERSLYVAEQILGGVFVVDLVSGSGEQILERKDLPMEGVIEGMVGSPC